MYIKLLVNNGKKPVIPAAPRAPRMPLGPINTFDLKYTLYDGWCKCSEDYLQSLLCPTPVCYTTFKS
jgi:hypothetical protein